MRNRGRYLIIALLVLGAVVLSACAGFGGTGAESKGTIKVGSKEFTEQHILGNMYKLLLEDAGYTVEYTSLGGTSENHRAITEGEIDVYPEYTGTALLTILKGEFDSSMSADDVYQTVKQQYEEQFNLTFLQPTKFNNTYCLTMPEQQANEMGIQTISDLSQHSGDLVFGTTQEFTERADGLPGLKETYDGLEFKEVRAMDVGLKYSGLKEGAIDVTTCFGTDGQIAAQNLKVIEDDKNFWPPYPVAPVVRQDTLEANPDVREALNKLAPLLDNSTMQNLNWQVDGQGSEADTVAREFLQENGLISSE